MNAFASRPHLWLEGQGDRALLDAILRHHGIAMPPDSYRVTDGSDELLRSAPLDVRGHPVVGIVLDADQPEDNNWCRLRDALRAEGVDSDPGLNARKRAFLPRPAHEPSSSARSIIRSSVR